MNCFQRVVPLALRTFPSQDNPSTSQTHRPLLRDLQVFSPSLLAGPMHPPPPPWTAPQTPLPLTLSCPVPQCPPPKPLRNLIDMFLQSAAGNRHLTHVGILHLHNLVDMLPQSLAGSLHLIQVGSLHLHNLVDTSHSQQLAVST